MSYSFLESFTSNRPESFRLFEAWKVQRKLESYIFYWAKTSIRNTYNYVAKIRDFLAQRWILMFWSQDYKSSKFLKIWAPNNIKRISAVAQCGKLPKLSESELCLLESHVNLSSTLRWAILIWNKKNLTSTWNTSIFWGKNLSSTWNTIFLLGKNLSST